MTYEYYLTLIGEYINFGRDPERLLGEIGFPSELNMDADGLASAIEIIAAAGDADIDALRKAAGLSITQFCRKFGLPFRTVQDWCAGRRQPPEYISRLIGYVMIADFQRRHLHPRKLREVRDSDSRAADQST